MTLRNCLLAIGDKYAAQAGLSRSQVSRRIFGDGKILDRISSGGDVTTRRYEHALRWFSANWPDTQEKPLLLKQALVGQRSVSSSLPEPSSQFESVCASRDVAKIPGDSA